MSNKESIIGFFGWIGNTVLAVASLTMKDIDLLFAIILKVATIISTICVALYYISKIKKNNEGTKRDIQKD